MRRLILLLFAVLLSGCTLPIPGLQAPTASLAPPTSTPAPTETPLGAPLTVPAGGFSVRPPDGWVNAIVSGTVTLAPSRAALERGSPGPDLVLTIDATPLPLLAAQFGPAAAQNAATFFELSSGTAQAAGYTISATSPITVDGHPGLVADLNAPSGAGRLAVILTPDSAIRVLGQADAATWPTQASLYAQLLDNLKFFAPPTPTPPPVDAATQPVIVDVGAPGFILRLGGSAGPPDGRFVSARGLAVAPDGTLYLAESRRGVWAFAPDGKLIRTFGADELLEAYDLARTPDGDLFVADFGHNAVARFHADGSFVGRWGTPGEAPEQFGPASPQRIALGPDGSIYALDARPGPEHNRVINSVVRFSQDGRFVERITLATDLTPADLVVDATGTIYLADPFNGVVKLDATGNAVARLGDPAKPEALAAGAIDLDRLGNLVVATYGAGVLKLAPSGLIIARGGKAAALGTIPAPGEFGLPNGVAAAPGGVVWVSDNSGEYSAVTALHLTVDEGAAATAQALAATPLATTQTTTPTSVLVRQWASEASASSFYAPDYDPAGATGAPNVPTCQDSRDAWAAADPNGLETLELRFAVPVFAVGLTVHQSYNPGFISKIELIDEHGATKSVYTATPALATSCPLPLTLTFDQTLTRVVAVRLTVDQRPGANWSEIDAVELVGVP